MASPITFTDAKNSDVGGITVRRLLPRATRRTIGAWCFIDHVGPIDVKDASMQVGPHPHIGLHTVSWMIEGEILHLDSLGSEQYLRPGQLNVMTAGNGISHAEITPLSARGNEHLVQLWVAQPEETRHGSPSFEHHGDLPVIEDAASSITVFIGKYHGEESPARTDTPLVGLDISLRHRSEFALDPTFEYGVLIASGAAQINDTTIEAGTLAYIPTNSGAVDIAPLDISTRLVLIGGTPFEETIKMHWNFVARSNDELRQAVTDWNSGSDRFGVVKSDLSRIPSPPMLN